MRSSPRPGPHTTCKTLGHNPPDPLLGLNLSPFFCSLDHQILPALPLYPQTVSRSAPFCTPTVTTTACPCHLSQSALPPGHRLPGPCFSPGFLSHLSPILPPTLSRPSPPAPGRACAGWGARSQDKAGTPPSPPQAQHKTHLQEAVRTELAGEAAGRSAQQPRVPPRLQRPLPETRKDLGLETFLLCGFGGTRSQ